MTWPEYFGALAILCLLVGFGLYIWEDLARRRRAAQEEYRRDWHLASSPHDRERDAA